MFNALIFIKAKQTLTEISPHWCQGGCHVTISSGFKCPLINEKGALEIEYYKTHEAPPHAYTGSKHLLGRRTSVGLPMGCPLNPRDGIFMRHHPCWEGPSGDAAAYVSHTPEGSPCISMIHKG